MRIAVGALLFEGNTFSPVISRRADFAAKYCASGPAVIDSLTGTGTEIGGALAEAARRNIAVTPLLATHGGAGGRVARDCLDGFVSEMLDRIAKALPVDGVYLALHGAFVAEGAIDVEGDLLRRVRALVAKTPIVVSCDMHAHITPAMIGHCDALIGYRHYPHDDTFETGGEAVALLHDIISGRLTPVMRACRAPMLAPAQQQRTKGAGPMVEVRGLAESLSVGPVRRVSYFCVQPWIDAPEIGFTAVAIADRDADAASAAARSVAEAAWARRNVFTVATMAPAEAIRAGLARQGYVVLADAADCVGGGASGDSVAVLAALLREAPQASAVMHIPDAETAALAHRAGKGARISVQLGNKLDPSYRPPLAVDAEVVALSDGRFTYSGGLMKGVAAAMGPSAVLRVGQVMVVVGSVSTYEYADEVFVANGVAARGHKFVVVKNPMNYQQAYADAGAQYILDTPGPTTPNLASLDWRHADRPLFPLDADFAPRFVAFPEA
jgi:microcystin degradation protein MlrC